MKNYLLLICVFAFYTCEVEKLAEDNPEFLLHKISFASDILTFSYNDNNNPVQLNIDDCIFYNYEYDNDNTLTTIYLEHTLQGNNVFSEYIFTSFNENGGHANITVYDEFSNIIDNQQLEVQFDGELITSIKTTFSDDTTFVEARFLHDSEGRLTEIIQENNLVAIPPCDLYINNHYSISSWEDNDVPSKYSIVRSLPCTPYNYYLFPNHYFSLKNPIEITADINSGFANSSEINLIYEYNNDGNTISVRDITQNEYYKIEIEYIEVN